MIFILQVPSRQVLLNDVPEGSDLFSLISLHDRSSGSAGTLAASRISSGTGDSLSIELYAEKGALRYSSDNADYFEYYTEETGHVEQENGWKQL